ncbi:tyrosine-type recombinase/integrase [Desulfobulbus oligotrophicus]|uniref:Site-specific integrase n=1 Tax=Desulfobulbus oligotrophicus TaxID=1909699 RepID=A0A7T5VE87_9BACT|nr:site-specific integrase [Desulfobulbus oligotrophicus]QQG66325.1 site-specific integrase [Desulfobulbus oligotrophicus]
MSVHQTKDGRWFVFYHKGFNKEEPNRTREYFGRGIEAELAAHARNHAIGLGVQRDHSAAEPTFADLAADYMEAHAGDMRPTSREDAAWKLDGVILPQLGHLPGSRIGPPALDGYVAGRAALGRKNTSIHRELSIIRAIIRWAVKRHKITHNPMDGFDLPRRDDAIISPPTAAELQALYRAAAPHLQRALLLSYYTGMRPGGSELLALRWEHVDRVNGSIFVESAKKGGMRARGVPIATELDTAMARWIQADRERGPLQWVVHYHGARIGSLKTAWAQAKRRAGITRRMRLYDLRHMAASDMLAGGADLKSVSEILGHASPDMTMRIYQHTITAQRRAAIAVLGKRLPIDTSQDDDKTG